MKKIFAFVLASLMVLSLVPASAFAFTICPAEHTTENCQYTQVGNPIPPSCSSAGYTVYMCNDCGTTFFGDVVPAAEHSWASTADATHKNVYTTCDSGESSIEWKKCTLCTTYMNEEGWHACEDGCGLYYYQATPSHDYQPVPGSGVGCELQYKCSACGDVKYKDGDSWADSATHTWDKDSFKIITEPTRVNGTDTTGTARYDCKVEGCDGFMIVDVNVPGCVHDLAQDNCIQQYVAETCFAAGQKAVFKCPDCNKYLVDNNRDSRWDTTLQNADGDDTTDLKFAAIEKLEHTPNASGYSATVNCVKTYVCAHCENVIPVTDHTNKHTYRTIPATCLVAGMEYAYCYDCKQDVSIVKPALGHKKCADDAVIEVTATCVNEGGKYYYCTRGNCDGVKTTITDTKNGRTYTKHVMSISSAAGIDSSNHNITNTYYVNGSVYTKEEYEAIKSTLQTCTVATLIVKKCAWGCSDYNYETEYVAATGHVPEVSVVRINCLRSNVTEKFGNLVKLEKATCKVCNTTLEDNYTPVDVKSYFNTLDEAKLYHGVYEYNPQTEQYSTRGNWDLIPVDRNVPGAYKAATCTTDGYQKYTCGAKGCNLPIFVTIPKGNHTVKEGTFVAASADFDCKATPAVKGVWAHFTCNDCGKTVIDTYNTIKSLNDADKLPKDFAKNYKFIVAETNAALVANACVPNLVYKTINNTYKNCDQNLTNCTAVGYWQCSECDATYSDFTATSKLNITKDCHEWVYLKNGVVATCEANGTLEVRYCANCNIIEVNAYYIQGTTKKCIAYAGEKVTINNKTADNTSKLYRVNAKGEGVKVEITVLRKDGTKTKNDKKVVIEKNGTLGSSYTTVPKLSHKNVYTNSNSYQTIPDLSNTASSADHSVATYRYRSCKNCLDDYIDQYKPALGEHENRYGQIIGDDCTGPAVTDRFCVICRTTISGNHKFPTNSDNTVKYTVVPNTCVADGYSYAICELCGYIEIPAASITAKSDSYHNSYMYYDYNYEIIGGGVDYAHNEASKTICTLCEKVVDETEPSDKELPAGLEVYVSTDRAAYMPGSTVYVTVSLDSLKGVDVWGVKIPVQYNPNLLVFKGYEFNTANSSFQNFVVNDVLVDETNYDEKKDEYVPTGKKISGGVVNVVANSAEVSTIKGSEDLVVLEFKVIGFASFGTPNFLVGDVTDSTNTEHKLEVVNTRGNVNAIYVESRFEPHYNICTFELLGFLNVDGDRYNEITLSDAIALYALIANNGYELAADADADGKVTMNDLTVLYNIISGFITKEDYVNPPVVEDADDIQYDENGNAILPEDFVPGRDGARN